MKEIKSYNINDIKILSKTMTYVEALEKGLVDYDSIDDFIDIWHDGNTGYKHLYEFLGMTFEQYKKFYELGYPGLPSILKK